ncbi:MAG: cysteine--tRNA ligase [Candidatus Pelagibacter sp. TMED165]|nr:MAG: cysteine--tRNA ligase [Candidatus Pelagibacter sp. TMED165]
MNNLQLTNSLTNKKEIFNPINSEKVSLYACGPTVYDNPHVGNARALVVFDLLFRILIEIYGKKKTIYVRNITDIDDKIVEASKNKKISILDLTNTVTKKFHKDCENLFCLNPTKEPKATDHVKGMIRMTEKLIDKKAAYENKGHVFFSVSSFKDYGKLSNKNPDDLKAGARVEVSKFKKDPLDFVLWKPSNKNDPGWESPWGRGRPGWHLECSVMSEKYLGKNFDIHGGGLDLIFPHHENEIAQSCVNNGTDKFANYWIHNGFVTMNKEKMSKSLGNITTVEDATKKYSGQVVRLSLLSAHYKQPLDWNNQLLIEQSKILDKWYTMYSAEISEKAPSCFNDLLDDMNTPLYISKLHELFQQSQNGDKNKKKEFNKACRLIGLFNETAEERDRFKKNKIKISEQNILSKIKDREQAKKVGNYKLADKIRDELSKEGIDIKDEKDTTIWSYK